MNSMTFKLRALTFWWLSFPKEMNMNYAHHHTYSWLNYELTVQSETT